MDYKKLFEKLPSSIVVVSPNYEILAATDAYLSITMREREQIVGLHFLKEAFPDKELSFDDNPVRKSIDKAIKTKEVDNLDVIRYDLPKPDGQYEERYWEASHIPVLANDGTVEYVVQHTYDVTQREITKKELSISNEKFRFMTETLPQLISTADADGKANYYNTRWEEYSGVPVTELLQNDWKDLIHPDEKDIAHAKWESAIKSKEQLQMECRFKDKDGDYRWFLNRTLPMKNEQGEVKMWISSATDIHDTRKLVHELLEANEQASILADEVQTAYEKEEAERKTLENLIMKAPAIFCLLKGPNHVYELVNEKYQQLFPTRELLHKSVAEALPEVKEQGFVELLDNVYNTGEVFIAEEVPIMLDKNNDGNLEQTYFTFSYQPVFEGEKVTGILVYAYDATETVLFRERLHELDKN